MAHLYGDAAHFPLQNPFALRVGQVMTGFGIGCGVGIGVGRPFNLRAVPVLGPIAGEAAGSFSSVGHHVQGLIRKLGIKNLQAGIGCGVGLGHGFGIGVTLKPAAAQQLKHIVEQGFSFLNEQVKSVMQKPHSQESASTSPGNPLVTENILPGLPSSGENKTVQAGTFLGDLLQNPLPVAAVKSQTRQNVQLSADSEVDRLQTENKILRTLITHQEKIEELKKENAALHALIAEIDSFSETEGTLKDCKSVKVENGSLEIGRRKCFECRRRGRQRR